MTHDDDAALLAIRSAAQRVFQRIGSSATLRLLLEERGRFDARYWKECGLQGWTAIGIPEAFGGAGLGLTEVCAIAELAGAAAVGAPFLETGYLIAQAISRHGDEALRTTWLPRLAAGDVIGAVAIADGAEPLSNGDGLFWTDGRLTGGRKAVPGAAVAEVALLVVTTDQGPALALASLAHPRVFRTVLDTFDNSRCTADLTFDGASAEQLPTAQPASVARELLDSHAVILAHQQIGGARAMLDLARHHASERRAFGQPIGTFQAIKHRIAEDYVLIELAAASAREAAAEAGSTRFAHSAAAARLLATEAYETTCRDCIQIHGGMGVIWESDLHLHQRRARTLALELGSTLRWQDMLVAELVGGGNG